MRIRFGPSRASTPRLDLQLSGSLHLREEPFLQLAAAVRNLGSAPLPLHQEGTRCQVLLVKRDLTEVPITLFPLFLLRESVAPGEIVGDLKLCRLPLPPEDIVWIRLNLRVVSAGTEWNASCVVPLGSPAQPLLVPHGPIPERKGLTSQIERQKKEAPDPERRSAQPLRPRREVMVARPTRPEPIVAAMSEIE